MCSDCVQGWGWSNMKSGFQNRKRLFPNSENLLQTPLFKLNIFCDLSPNHLLTNTCYYVQPIKSDPVIPVYDALQYYILWTRQRHNRVKYTFCCPLSLTNRRLVCFRLGAVCSFGLDGICDVISSSLKGCQMQLWSVSQMSGITQPAKLICEIIMKIKLANKKECSII